MQYSETPRKPCVHFLLLCIPLAYKMFDLCQIIDSFDVYIENTQHQFFL